MAYEKLTDETLLHEAISLRKLVVKLEGSQRLEARRHLQRLTDELKRRRLAA